MKAIRMKQICWLFAGIVGAWALSPAVAAAAENGIPNHRVMNLRPDGSSNNPAGGPRPNLEIFYPLAAASVVPVTMVICPGGGYGGLSPYEREMAIYFRALGYTAVVVNYRVAPNRYPAPYADAARAIRLLRQHAGEWKIPAKKIALMGGSAGGHLAALVATRPNLYADPNDDLAATVSARPDRLILVENLSSPAGARPCGKAEDRGLRGASRVGGHAPDLSLSRGGRRSGAGGAQPRFCACVLGRRCAGRIARLSARRPRTAFRLCRRGEPPLA
jgi:hypothetical protein